MAGVNRGVEPFTNINDINLIKHYLQGQDNKRNYTIFVFGINVGLRAGDLLRHRWADLIEDGEVKRKVGIEEEKTGKYKTYSINDAAAKAIQDYYNEIKPNNLDDYVFKSRKGDSHLQVRSLNRIIKDTAKTLNIKGRYGTHSLRKTFGYHRYKNGVPIEYLQSAFNHSSRSITLRYIGITEENIEEVYNNINL